MPVRLTVFFARTGSLRREPVTHILAPFTNLLRLLIQEQPVSAILAEKAMERPVPPLLIANTLLVPGYIDEEEIRNIADFICSIHPEIPYSLLAFYPHFYMSDLPLTSKKLADGCLAVAREAGLEKVRLGNVHLFA